MSSPVIEQHLTSVQIDRRVHEDSRTMPAMLAGLIAAVIGGGVWFLIVVLTGYEVGWVAWGVGVAVGAAMGRATPVRNRSMALRAGALAGVGLLAGKMFIVQYHLGSNLAGQLLADDSIIEEAVFYQMLEGNQLPPEVAAEIDAMPSSEATLSQGGQDRLNEALQLRVAALTDDERQAIVDGMARDIRAEVSVMEGLWYSTSPWDALWLVLAVGTAWRMLNREPHSEVAAPAA